jgi:hypothetical protein
MTMRAAEGEAGVDADRGVTLRQKDWQTPAESQA